MELKEKDNPIKTSSSHMTHTIEMRSNHLILGIFLLFKGRGGYPPPPQGVSPLLTEYSLKRDQMKPDT
jgi:hypothetical protein